MKERHQSAPLSSAAPFSRGELPAVAGEAESQEPSTSPESTARPETCQGTTASPSTTGKDPAALPHRKSFSGTRMIWMLLGITLPLRWAVCRLFQFFCFSLVASPRATLSEESGKCESKMPTTASEDVPPVKEFQRKQLRRRKSLKRLSKSTHDLTKTARLLREAWNRRDVDLDVDFDALSYCESHQQLANTIASLSGSQERYCHDRGQQRLSAPGFLETR